MSEKVLRGVADAVKGELCTFNCAVFRTIILNMEVFASSDSKCLIFTCKEGNLSSSRRRGRGVSTVYTMKSGFRQICTVSCPFAKQGLRHTLCWLIALCSLKCSTRRCRCRSHFPNFFARFQKLAAVPTRSRNNP